MDAARCSTVVVVVDKTCSMFSVPDYMILHQCRSAAAQSLELEMVAERTSEIHMTRHLT